MHLWPSEICFVLSSTRVFAFLTVFVMNWLKVPIRAIECSTASFTDVTAALISQSSAISSPCLWNGTRQGSYVEPK